MGKKMHSARATLAGLLLLLPFTALACDRSPKSEPAPETTKEKPASSAPAKEAPAAVEPVKTAEPLVAPAVLPATPTQPGVVVRTDAGVKDAGALKVDGGAAPIPTPFPTPKGMPSLPPGFPTAFPSTLPTTIPSIPWPPTK